MTPTSWSIARRALAQQIRARSHEDHALVDFLAVVAAGAPVCDPDGESLRPTPALQRKAAALLERRRRHELLELLALLDRATLDLTNRPRVQDIDPVA